MVSPLPVAGEPLWDAACQEWVLTDSDGISYCGSTPGACYCQFVEALHSMAQHLQRSLYGDAEYLFNNRGCNAVTRAGLAVLAGRIQ